MPLSPRPLRRRTKPKRRPHCTPLPVVSARAVSPLLVVERFHHLLAITSERIPTLTREETLRLSRGETAAQSSRNRTKGIDSSSERIRQRWLEQITFLHRTTDLIQRTAEDEIPLMLLIKLTGPNTLSDLSPFVDKQNTKHHHRHVFESPPELLAEISIRWPRADEEKALRYWTSESRSFLFSTDWQHSLSLRR